MNSLRVPLITQLLVHKHHIECAFVVDYVVAAFFDQIESILDFKLYLRIVCP